MILKYTEHFDNFNNISVLYAKLIQLKSIYLKQYLSYCTKIKNAVIILNISQLYLGTNSLGTHIYRVNARQMTINTFNPAYDFIYSLLSDMVQKIGQWKLVKVVND